MVWRKIKEMSRVKKELIVNGVCFVIFTILAIVATISSGSVGLEIAWESIALGVATTAAVRVIAYLIQCIAE